MVTDADLLYDTLRRVNIDFLIAGEKASEFLADNLKAKVAVLNNALNKDDSKTAYSSREEHPDWFQGLETNCATKVSPLLLFLNTCSSPRISAKRFYRREKIWFACKIKRNIREIKNRMKNFWKKSKFIFLNYFKFVYNLKFYLILNENKFINLFIIHEFKFVNNINKNNY